MRSLALLAALAAALAGCAGGPPAGAGDDGPLAPAETPLPAAERHEIHVGQGADGVAEPAAGRCELQPWCFGYPFAIPVGREADLHARLDWALAASDFDLYLTDGEGTVLAQATTHGPHMGEALDARLGAGTYSVLVVPYAVPSDDAVLQMSFEA